MAEPEQQLSSEGCICGSVMGSQYMCRTDRGSILQAERWNVQGGSWSRLQRGLNNEFSLSDRLLCAPPPSPPPPHTPQNLDIKRCHRLWSVTAYDTGTAYRWGGAEVDEDWQNDTISQAFQRSLAKHREFWFVQLWLFFPNGEWQVGLVCWRQRMRRNCCFCQSPHGDKLRSP